VPISLTLLLELSLLTAVTAAAQPSMLSRTLATPFRGGRAQSHCTIQLQRPGGHRQPVRSALPQVPTANIARATTCAPAPRPTTRTAASRHRALVVAMAGSSAPSPVSGAAAETDCQTDVVAIGAALASAAATELQRTPTTLGCAHMVIPDARFECHIADGATFPWPSLAVATLVSPNVNCSNVDCC
jgi:hypothetical protein